MRTREKGFTLIELLIVVIVIGILASIAVPQFATATERAKSAKALAALMSITQAEKMYRANSTTGVYIACGSNADLTGNLGNYIEMTDVISDPDWVYTVDSIVASPAAFRAVATRQATVATIVNPTITFTQDGVRAGTWPY